jgi:phospholipid/cholesterol/gamma-HCH transport system substrate-binding protein
VFSTENRAAFTAALADIAAVSRTLAARKGTLDAGIAGAARTFDNAARATAQLEPVLERIGHSADALEKMGSAAAGASTRAAVAVDAVGADAQRFISATLPDLQRLLAELTVLSTSLRRLSEQTERNPSSLLFGRGPVTEGPGEASRPAQKP